MKLLLASLFLLIPLTVHAEDLGNLSANAFDPNSSANPYGAGNPFLPNSITNEFGRYGSPYSNQSATNPYATDAPRLYDQQGNYRGKLSENPMILIRPVTPTAAMVLRSRRTRSRIPTAPGIPTALVAPPIPMAVACRLKGGRFGCRRNILEEKRGGGTF